MRAALLPLLVSLALACSQGPEPAADTHTTAHDPLVVYVTNEPLRAMAERVGGDAVEVHLPTPQGIDPAHWSPEAVVVARYQAADLVLRQGAGYDPWIERATLREQRVVDTTAPFADLLIRTGAPTHRHGPKGEHSHGATAFTTWLDPSLAASQARAVGEALADLRPEDAAALRERAAQLAAGLEALDARLARATARLSAPPIYSHPVYAYFDRRYELAGRSLHWEPEVPPDEDGWRALEALIDEQPAHLLIWEAEPREDVVRRLAGLGVESLVFAPCGNRCGDDWLAVQEANVARLEAAAGTTRDD